MDTSNDPIVLDWSASETVKANNAQSLKRKQPEILGPGQTGHEAKNLTELSSNKRPHTGSDGSNMDDGEDEQPVIAERLAALQKALEEEEQRDQELQDSEPASEKHMSSDSVYQLLHQALQSADKQQLEKALRIRDADAIGKSCRELDSESIAALLVALTHRMATKPNRADHLSIWLNAILGNPHVTVEHLLPLQNLLKERLEIFPLLLELEGRLDQLAGT